MTQGISEATVWGAHKAYIRGILIMAGLERKNRTKENKIALTKEIYELEQQHKTTRDGIVIKIHLKKRGYERPNRAGNWAWLGAQQRWTLETRAPASRQP